MKRNQAMWDPVCGKRVNRTKAHILIVYKSRKFLLCCPKCQSEFEKTPEKYIPHMKRR